MTEEDKTDEFCNETLIYASLNFEAEYSDTRQATAFQAGAKWREDNPGWIAVADQPWPKESGMYLVYGPSRDPRLPFFFLAYFDSDPQMDIWQSIPSMGKQYITHWMPLPNAPKVSK